MKSGQAYRYAKDDKKGEVKASRDDGMTLLVAMIGIQDITFQKSHENIETHEKRSQQVRVIFPEQRSKIKMVACTPYSQAV